MQERTPGQGGSPPPTLSAGLRRSIASRAASLDELLASLRAGVGAAEAADPPAVDMPGLAAWLATSAPGDAEAFARRLAWDGLEPVTAAWLLTDEGAGVLAPPEPAWLTWLDRVLEHAPRVAAEVATGGVPEADLFTSDGLPYADLLVPMVRAAADGLDARLGAWWREATAASARDAWSLQLARELAGVVQMAVHERFDAFRAQAALVHAETGQGGEPPAGAAADAYRSFVASMLEDGLAGLFGDLPVLARHVATVIDRHVANVAALLGRLREDHDALSATFGAGAPLTPVASVLPALSDPHEGRQRVALLTCAGGVRLVYKPRDVRLEHAFGLVLDALAARGCRSAPPGLRVVVREGYGWEGFVEPGQFESRDDVAQYYRKAGGLLCVSWLLGGRDLHMENLVATREGPVLVDLEALFAPGDAGAGGDAPTGAETGVGDAATSASSCLQTGLLSYVAGGPDTPLQEVGGLRGRGAGTSTLARRVWRGLRTDAIRFEEDTTLAVPEHNAVRVDGERQPPEAFAEALVEGFADAYRHLWAAYREWTAAGGVLEAFAGTHARVFTRDTNQYGMLLHVLAAPRYQQRGTRRSAAYDILARGLLGAPAPPAEWPVIQAERASLDSLDVPRFTVPVDGSTVFAGQRAVHERRGVQPGLAAAKQRWQAMSEADLAGQCAAIRRVLDELRRPRFSAPWPGGPAAAVETDAPAAWRACATWIGHELIARANRHRQSILWGDAREGRLPALRACSVHDGALGPALLLAALASAGAGPEFDAAARAALRPVLDRWAVAGDDGSMPIGGTTGLGSVVYGLCTAGTLLGDAEAVNAGLEVARALTPARVADDAHLDVVAGAAGAALALLAAFRVRPDPALVASAIACGDHLLAREDADAPRGAWRAPQGFVYTGFAHGIAGMAAALAGLADATGLERFHDGASRAYRRLAEARAGAAAWPIAFRPGQPGAGRDLPAMIAWCHGAPGIAMALLAAPDALRDDSWRAEVEVAVAGCLSAATHKTEHVCCGNLSRAEALFTAARRLGHAAAGAAAARVAAGVLRRTRQLGHVRLSAVPYDYRVFAPAFFQGTSGAGYQLLRMASGGRLPSVLALEARARVDLWDDTAFPPPRPVV